MQTKLTDYLFFKTVGNIVKILGDQLITNETIALVELVKNSYDADATKVEIIFRENPNCIIIRDNGSGMTITDIEQGWGNIGISMKRNLQKTPKLGRPLLGEKGVGRFASQKIGSKLTINTRTNKNSQISHVVIDWDMFSLDRDLTSIRFPINNIDFDFKYDTGTELIIENLTDDWDKEKIKETNNRLQNLLHPKDKELGLFKIEIKSERFPNIEREITHVEDLLDLVPHQIKGSVNIKRNIINYEYVFRDHTNKTQKIKKEINIGSYLVKNNCGDFTFEIWSWETRRKVMKKYGLDSIDMNILESLSGIRIYRDGFRVFPYGNIDNDWLRLDERRYRRLGEKLSNKQLLGLISISKKNNPLLIDKTDREGIVDIPEMKIFSSIVLEIIANLEAERQPFYQSVIKKLVDDSDTFVKELKTIESDLNKTIRKKEITKEEIQEIKTHLKTITKSVDTYFKSLIEPLYVQASISTIYSVPLHEIKEFIDKTYYLVEKLIRDFRNISINKKIKMLEEIKEHLDSIINVIIDTNVILKGTRKENVSLSYILNYVLKLYDKEIANKSIEIINELGNFTIKSRKNQLVSIFMNIINNALYWVDRKDNENPKIKIKALKTSENKLLIIFSDNGPGFIDPPEVLLSPFFTRKPNGTGLGLYLTNILTKRLNGLLVFNLSKYKKYLLRGASIGLELGDIVNDS